MPTPSNQNLRYLSGALYFDRYVNGAKTGNWRHMGLVDSLEVSTSYESFKVKNAMSSTRGIYREVQTGSELTWSAKFKEFIPENIALALGGSVTTWTQASGTASDTALGSVKKGYGIDTGYRRITVTAVKKSSTVLVNAGSATGTGDYWVDSMSGQIFFLDTTTTSGLVDGDAVTWTGSYPALTSKPQVNGLSAGQIIGALKFVSDGGGVGNQVEVLIPMASVMGDGALALIQDGDAAAGTLKGTAMEDTTMTAGERYYRERVL